MKKNEIFVNNARVVVRSTAKEQTKEKSKWKKCKNCQKNFISARSTAIYCSNDCRVRNYLKRTEYTGNTENTDKGKFIQNSLF